MSTGKVSLLFALVLCEQKRMGPRILGLYLTRQKPRLQIYCHIILVDIYIMCSTKGLFTVYITEQSV